MKPVLPSSPAPGTTSASLSRRQVLAGLAGSAALAASGRTPGASPVAKAGSGPAWDTMVVGAGVFGAWTAWHLRQAGERVLLVDAHGPAHSRASSGGESRMTRGMYGADRIYAAMARDSLPEWRWLSGRSGLPVFHPTGVLMFFTGKTPFATDSISTHQELQLPLEQLDQQALRRRYPQADWSGIEFGLLEPGFGVLMARRAVQTLVAEFVAAGGEYRQTAVAPPASNGDGGLRSLRTADGASLSADRYVFACGPWLPALFPALLASRILPTRQEVFFFATPDGDPRFGSDRFPGWAEFSGGELYYGMPDLEARGFKIANDRRGPSMDPDAGSRQVSVGGLADVRNFLARRFPALAGQPLTESRVCQYENSANGDFLIDWHPELANVLLVGGGSGHGFKHGPAVGRYAAALARGTLGQPEPRFSLATKAGHGHEVG